MISSPQFPPYNVQVSVAASECLVELKLYVKPAFDSHEPILLTTNTTSGLDNKVYGTATTAPSTVLDNLPIHFGSFGV